MADYLYDSRNAWFQHELEAHRSSWQCIPGCDISLTHEKDFDTHLLEQHTELASAPMIAALKRTARRAGNNSEKATCPFCNIEMLVKGLKRHIGRHQEQLALFALPPNLEATDEDKQDGETISSNEVVDVEGWKDEQLSDFSDSENPDESSVSQPNAGQREVVWCPECQGEWYRDQLYDDEQCLACVHGHPIKHVGAHSPWSQDHYADDSITVPGSARTRRSASKAPVDRKVSTVRLVSCQQGKSLSK
jgi:hypothetical protein